MLRGKNIVICVTGGIAAYKAVDVARFLHKEGATVDVVMTEAATRFVSPLTFQALVHRPVVTEMFHLLAETEIGHVSLAERADVILVAPATANTIAKMANGIADNMVTCTVLAATCPVVIAPAMNDNMWANQATQANIRILKDRGMTIIPPATGTLASGKIGTGKLASAENIVGITRYLLTRQGPLTGKRIMITAGGTREAIDPVRFISNRSSGKMGYAAAQTALDLGAEVTLITANATLPDPPGATVIRVTSALEMRDAVFRNAELVDALIMAAAVADYRVAAPAAQKVKKGAEEWILSLARNPDILSEVSANRKPRLRALIGFAAETEDLLANAQAKLRSKGLDVIVANDVAAADSGFEVETNRVIFLDANGGIERLPLMSKVEVAERLLARVTTLLTKGNQ